MRLLVAAQRITPFVPWQTLLPNPAAEPQPRPDAAPVTLSVDAARARVLWLGDSLTQWWTREGAASWTAELAPLGSLNRAVAGDRTEHLLWRIEHGLLDGLRPELVVVMIGANNVGMHTSGQIAEAIEACVAAIGRRLPRARILLLGLLPIGPRWNPVSRQTVTGVNARLSPRRREPDVCYLDVTTAFTDSDGAVRAELLPNIHLSPAGYIALTEAVAPVVRALLGRAPAVVRPRPPLDVSVVIPARNERENIGLLVADLLAQRVPASEILVVDTGSTDGTRDVVRALCERHAQVRLVCLERGFPGAGRNAGVEAAHGEWIAFVDAGMRVPPDWLAALCAPIEADGAVDCVLGGLEPVTDSRSQRAAALAFVPARRPTPDGSGAWRGFCLPSSLVRRQRILDVDGFPEELRSGEDLVFFRRLEARSRIAYAPGAVVRWSHAAAPPAVWRRFRTYAEHSFHAGLMRDWFDVIARRYLALAALSGPLLPFTAPALLLARAAVMQRRKPEFVAETASGRAWQLLEVAFYLGIIDAATMRAWVGWRRAGRPRLESRA